MHYSSIDFSFQDYPEPDATCVVIFLSGCYHNCKDCQNKSLQNPDYGIYVNSDFNDESQNGILAFESLIKSKMDYYNTSNIVFEGGDPLFNKDSMYFIFNIILDFEDYNFCIYTGDTVEDVKKKFGNEIKLLTNLKYIKCGSYKAECSRKSGKTMKKFTLASSNQDFYNNKLFKISRKGILKYGFKYKLLKWLGAL